MTIVTLGGLLGRVRDVCVRMGSEPWLGRLGQTVVCLLVFIGETNWVVETLSVPARSACRPRGLCCLDTHSAV